MSSSVRPRSHRQALSGLFIKCTLRSFQMFRYTCTLVLPTANHKLSKRHLNLSDVRLANGSYVDNLNRIRQTQGMENGKKLEHVVGENVRRLRSAAGRSQARLADDVAETGISWTRSTVAQIETGRRGLAFDEALALSAVLDSPLAELLVVERDVTSVVIRDGGWSPQFLRQVIPGTAGDLPISESYSSPTRVANLDRIGRGLVTNFRKLAAWRQELGRRWELETYGELTEALKQATPLDSVVAARMAVSLCLQIDRADIVFARRSRGWPPLEDERDRRMAADPRSQNASDRTRQALLGHITRAVIADTIESLRDELEGAATRSVAATMKEDQQ